MIEDRVVYFLLVSELSVFRRGWLVCFSMCTAFPDRAFIVTFPRAFGHTRYVSRITDTGRRVQIEFNPPAFNALWQTMSQTKCGLSPKNRPSPGPYSSFVMLEWYQLFCICRIGSFFA